MASHATTARSQTPSVTRTTGTEQRIVQEFLTDFAIDQALASARSITGENPSADDGNQAIKVAVSLAWQDLLMECPGWARRLHNPLVDFAVLASLCEQRVRRRALGRR